MNKTIKYKISVSGEDDVTIYRNLTDEQFEFIDSIFNELNCARNIYAQAVSIEEY